MSAEVFVSQLLLEPVPRLGLWRSHQTAMIHLPARRWRLVMGAPFYCDLASVPNWAWPALDCGPNHLSVPAFAHDYTARLGARLIPDNGLARSVTFEESLVIFSDVMEWAGISPEDRWKVISAVKVAPARYWHRKLVGWRPKELP